MKSFENIFFFCLGVQNGGPQRVPSPMSITDGPVSKPGGGPGGRPGSPSPSCVSEKTLTGAELAVNI